MPAKKKATEPQTAKPQTEELPAIDFEIVDSVTLPTLKWPTGETIFVEFSKPIEVRETVDPKTGEQKEIEVATVRELRSGSKFELVCGVVLKKEMDLKYESDSYQGKCFKMTKHPVVGKRYHTFEIYEISVKKSEG